MAFIASGAPASALAAPAPSGTVLFGEAASVGSTATSPAYSASTVITIDYVAAYDGSGLAAVELWARAPGDLGFSEIARDTSPATSGSFSYLALAGDGTYDFYTVAVDGAGNREPDPLSAPDTATVVDTQGPVSTAASPTYRPSTTIEVDYAAADAGPSGLDSVQLWAQAPSEVGFTEVATDMTPAGSGSFSYPAAAGDGTYRFYTVAIDKAGNAESAPNAADATTVVDTAAPASTAHSPDLSSSPDVEVDYDAADSGAGLASVELWARSTADSAYSRAATDTPSEPTGTMSFHASGGDGRYEFYTVAVDAAGNRERAPDSPDGTTLVDTTAPGSSASAPEVSASPALNVSYTGSDAGADTSGLARVELWAEGPTDGSFMRVATDVAPGASGEFSFTASAGDGTYRFYTVSTDKAGNTEAAPAGADATTVVDTQGPSVAIAFPGTGAAYTAATWDDGCGTPGGDICGTVADATSGVHAVEVSIRRESDGSYWDGNSFSSADAVLLPATGASDWSADFPSTNFPADGSYTVTAHAVDAAGNAAETAVAEFTIDAPPRAGAGGPYSGAEGTPIQLAGTASGDAKTTIWSYEPVGQVDAGASCVFADAGEPTTTFRCSDDGTYKVMLTVDDGTNQPVAESATVTVANAAPTATIDSPVPDAQVSRSSPVTMRSSFKDPGGNDTHAGGCSIDWGDGATGAGAVTESAGSGTGECTASHTYTTLGAYVVSVNVTDDDGDSGSASVAIRVAGSPPAAYPSYPAIPPAQACTTIAPSVAAWQANVNTAAAGTVQCLADGSYSSTVNLRRSAPGAVTAASVSAYGAVLTGGLVIQKGSGGGISLQGLDVENEAVTPPAGTAGDCLRIGAGASSSTASMSVRYSLVRHCNRNGIVMVRPPCSGCTPTTGYSSDVTIDNVEIADVGNTTTSAQLVILRGASNTLTHSKLHDTPNDGVLVWGDGNVIAHNVAFNFVPADPAKHPDFVQSWEYARDDGAQGLPATHLVVEGNRYHDAVGPDAHFVLLEGGGAGSPGAIANPTIRSNEISDIGTGSHAIILGTSTTPGDVTDAVVENNTFYGSGRVEFNNASWGTLTNNVFSLCTDDGPWRIDSGAVAVSDNTGSGTAGCTATGANAANRDPLFVDPAAGDFHLQPTSPEIDAGTGTPAGNDIDDGRRILDLAVDRGGDEN